MSKEVSVHFDLNTRDGRLAVEVRLLATSSVIYSCAYGSQSERILALQRARAFCDIRGLRVAQLGRKEKEQASWQ